MSRGRLEAFSDGVIAVLITIMVLELRPPEGDTFHDLVHSGFVGSLLIYVLSFVYLAIYWNNHHHLLQAVERINGAVLWANMNLLFWLSLVPFTTAWVGDAGAVRADARPSKWLVVPAQAGTHSPEANVCGTMSPRLRAYALIQGLSRLSSSARWRDRTRRLRSPPVCPGCSTRG